MTDPPAGMPSGPRLTRRAALGGLALAGVVVGAAGCTHGVDMRESRRSPSPHPTKPTADPDVVLAEQVLAEEQAQLDRVVATTAAFPALADRLASAEEAHRRHVELLRDAVPGHDVSSAAPSPSASAEPSAAAPSSSGPSSPSTPVPHRRDRALATLVEAEEALTLSGKRASFSAESGAFARVLASMAASAAQQAALLRGGHR